MENGRFRVILECPHRSLRRWLHIIPKIRVFFALALLVLHYSALRVQRLHVERSKQMAHPVRFQKKSVIEGGCGDGLEVIGPVVVCGTVQVGCTDLFKSIDVCRFDILASTEHQMFEEMRKTSLTWLFVVSDHLKT
jgi:hypothetical protein